MAISTLSRPCPALFCPETCRTLSAYVPQGLTSPRSYPVPLPYPIR